MSRNNERKLPFWSDKDYVVRVSDSLFNHVIPTNLFGKKCLPFQHNIKVESVVLLRQGTGINYHFSMCKNGIEGYHFSKLSPPVALETSSSPYLCMTIYHPFEVSLDLDNTRFSKKSSRVLTCFVTIIQHH